MCQKISIEILTTCSKVFFETYLEYTVMHKLSWSLMCTENSVPIVTVL